MVAYFVTEDTKGRDGDYQGDGRERNYTRVFSVYMTSPFDGAITAINALGIPRMYVPYVTLTEMDLTAWCKTITATPTTSSLIWKVTCKYSSRLNRPDQNQSGPNGPTPPDQRVPEISLDTTRVTVPLLADTGGKKILNSANALYDPPPEEEEKRLVLKITRNELTYDYVFANDIQDSLNDRPFFGFKKGAVKCSHISAVNQFEQGIYFWKVSYQFDIRPEKIPPNALMVSLPATFPANQSEAWTRWYLDRGFNDKDGKPCVDKFKQPMTTPALLDGNGLQLAFDGVPVYRGHRVFPFRDFRALNLY